METWVLFHQADPCATTKLNETLNQRATWITIVYSSMVFPLKKTHQGKYFLCDIIATKVLRLQSQTQ